MEGWVRALYTLSTQGAAESMFFHAPRVWTHVWALLWDGGRRLHGTHMTLAVAIPLPHISQFLQQLPQVKTSSFVKSCRDWFQFRIIIINNNTNCSSPILVILQRRSNPLNLFTKMKNPVSEKLLFVYCVSVCVLFTHAQDVNVEVSAANEKTAAVEDTNSHINVQERKSNFKIYCSPFLQFAEWHFTFRRRSNEKNRTASLRQHEKKIS